MILYKTLHGPVIMTDGQIIRLDADWNALIASDNLVTDLKAANPAEKMTAAEFEALELLAPIGSQEVWAAGVTYLRSKAARMEESGAAGGSDYYDRVYRADRPELFFKAPPSRVVGHRGRLHLRSDSKWIVPEPELTLVINPRGKIIGYTIGDDLSCRDIEGENPLYLPQAKTFDGCAGLGPGIFVSNDPLPSSTEIRLEVLRNGSSQFEGSTSLASLHRKLEDLVGYLFRETTFPTGCFLMTGTGIVPPDDFSLQPGDEIQITIEPIGTLINTVGDIRRNQRGGSAR